MTATIGKKELCEALGWSRPKLDRRLKADENFPIACLGDQSGGWQFDLAAVRDYLSGVTRSVQRAGARSQTAKTSSDKRRTVSAPAAKAIDPAQLRDTVAPPLPEPPRRSAYHAGEATAKQRKDDADATLREMKIATMAGDLVPRSKVEQVYTLIVASIANDLDSLPEEVVKSCSLPLEATDVIRAKIDAIRTGMVIHGEQILKTDA